MTGLTPIEVEVLTVLGRLSAEIEAAPRPAKHDVWALREWQEDRDNGPRYLPSRWFGDGSAMPPKYTSRYIRAVHSLRAKGLVLAVGDNGRLWSLKLTDAGRQALADLDAADAVKPAGH